MLDRTCWGSRRESRAASRDTDLRSLMHDLGHGLAAMSYLVDGMSRDSELSPDARHRAQLLEKQLERLIDTIESRGMRPETESVEVRGLLAQLVALTALATPSWVALRPGIPVSLRGDPTALWRMVTNLVDNAVRAVGSGGTVELDAYQSNDMVVVEVLDDGPGFGAGPAGTTGSGLGIVDSLARACGGSVRVCRTPTGGVRTRLLLPVSGVPTQRG